MGINGLWDVIGRGEVVSIAKYATDHFNQHGRPLRVAVDEPGWRFNNLTPQQVEMIRKKEPAANPIEKTVIWRIFLLMKLNINPFGSSTDLGDRGSETSVEGAVDLKWSMKGPNY
jgi:Holliday junction resolvase YEN1